MPAAAGPVDVPSSTFRIAIRFGVGQHGTGSCQVFREPVGAVADIRKLQPVDVLKPEAQVGHRLRLDPDDPGDELRHLGSVVNQDHDPVRRGQVVAQVVLG